MNVFKKYRDNNGFKSFANKIVFEFPHGITGIEGPTAAERVISATQYAGYWGEQSAKQLRGSSDGRCHFPPARRTGGRWVLPTWAIVFDNHDRRIALDYDEVKVARRVYRSGESEYLFKWRCLPAEK